MKLTALMVAPCLAMGLVSPLIAQSSGIPDIGEPIRAQYRTTTHWACAYDDAAPIEVEVRHAYESITHGDIRISRVDAVRVGQTPITPALLAATNMWLADKAVESITVVCLRPTRTAINILAWPQQGEEPLEWRLIADGEGRLHKAD